MSRVGSLLGAYVTLSIASQVAKKTKLLKGGKMKRINSYYRKKPHSRKRIKVKGYTKRGKRKNKAK